ILRRGTPKGPPRGAAPSFCSLRCFPAGICLRGILGGRSPPSALVLAVVELVAGAEEAVVEVVAAVDLVNFAVVGRDHDVVAGTADEEVVAGAAGHGVVAAVADHGVTAGAAVEVVVTGVAADGVVA